MSPAETPALSPEYAAVLDERREALRRTCAGLPFAAAPFVWEIGSGHGHFLTAYAAAHPDRLCVGIDIILERIARADRKRERARLGNLHFVRADALDFLSGLPAPARFSALYILFPDPWPKRRHHKNRLMQPDFIDKIAARAGEGARLYFRTDYAPYFAEARAHLAGHPAWRLVDGPWPFESPTVFERRAGGHHSLVAERNLRIYK